MVGRPGDAHAGPMTATLHIENAVHDYASWKEAFDRFERFRAEGGVRRHRVSRPVDDPHAVVIDLDFDTAELAEAFRQRLEKVWASPRSRGELAAHAVATVQEVIEQRPS